MSHKLQPHNTRRRVGSRTGKAVFPVSTLKIFLSTTHPRKGRRFRETRRQAVSASDLTPLRAPDPMPPVDDTTRGALRDAPGPTEGDSLPPGDGGDRLGPLLGSLPPDVLREVLLPELDELSCACFALSAGACLRAVKDAGLSWKVNVCARAARGGDLRLLQYAHERGCPWTEETCYGAAWGGNLECLRYAHGRGCPWDEYTCTEAARGGHLDCLRYAHEHDCPWDSDTCTEAARLRYYEYRYAHEHDCPWDSDTCTEAARGGHLDCLRYAHEHGCPWGEFTCSAAARGGHLECLRYAHEHGCPWGEFTCSATAWGGHPECLRYAHEHGCPWDGERYRDKTM